MKTKICARLDKDSYKKVYEFSIMNFVNICEVLRVLIENSEIKIDNIKDKNTILSEAWRGIHIEGSKTVPIPLNEELVLKTNKMKIENDASYSEIVRHLIIRADLKSFEYKSVSENRKEKLRIARENKKIKTNDINL